MTTGKIITCFMLLCSPLAADLDIDNVFGKCLRGPPGPPGPQGPRGPKGDKGPDGIEGANGLNGRHGQAGDQGPIGCTGPRGPKGCLGKMGDCGDKGATGITPGPTGPKGPTGDTGPNCFPATFTEDANGSTGESIPTGTGSPITDTEVFASQDGVYEIFWAINIDQFSSVPNNVVELRVNKNVVYEPLPNTDVGIATTGISESGYLYGTAILSLEMGNSVALFNVSTGDIQPVALVGTSGTTPSYGIIIEKIADLDNTSI